MSSEQLLYLFSSNIRPLYEQDILDLLALPQGAPYRFRYERQYINEAALSGWTEGGLDRERVLVHFSLQQEAKYQDPVFIPVRLGTVRRTYRVGDFYVVDFFLNEYVSLGAPPKDARGRDDLAPVVRAYADFLKRNSVDRPYEYSASLSGNILTLDPPLDTAPEDHASLFQRTTRYLQRTHSFREARFYRLLEMKPAGAQDEPAAGLQVNQDLGAIELDAGKTYELRVLQAQPIDVSGRDTFKVSVDEEIVRIIGRPAFDIASRYDVISLILHAVVPDKHEARETVLVIEPDPASAPAVQGPRMRLSLRVRPPTGRVVGTIGVATLGLVLVGLPSLVSMPGELKIVLIGIGSLVASTLATLGLKR